MFKNILIPTDGSALSRRAAKDAVRLAKKLGARVTGFYVAPTYRLEIYGDYVPPDLVSPLQHAANAKKTALRHLDFVQKTAAQDKVPCACDYVMSDGPADAIVKAARKHRCDLIYMGSHGRSGLAKLLLGSQTSKVLAHTRIPVLVHR
jgi:nucleotide-binding universal stress UspA family protein